MRLEFLVSFEVHVELNGYKIALYTTGIENAE